MDRNGFIEAVVCENKPTDMLRQVPRKFQDFCNELAKSGNLRSVWIEARLDDVTAIV